MSNKKSINTTFQRFLSLFTTITICKKYLFKVINKQQIQSGLCMSKSNPKLIF